MSERRTREFKLYSDYADQFKRLDDAAAGQLIKAIFAYVNDEPVPDISDTSADMAFSFISAQIDRDQDVYRRRCEKNRENGSKGGRPTKRQTDNEKPNGYLKNHSVSENEQTEPQAAPEPPAEEPKKTEKALQEERFSEFWAAYPRKTGKQAALKAWMKIRPNAELHERIVSAVNSAKESRQWKEDHGRYIPNPTTWLNQGRWDDEFPASDNGTDTAAHRAPTDNPWTQ